MREGSRAYRAGAFVEAQQHFQKVLELDPAHRNAGYLLARSIQAQFKPAVRTPENIAKAREALAAYQKVLAQNPHQGEAYEAISSLYGALGEEKQQRDWILARANLETLPKERRARTFLVLAAKDGDCAQAFTELPENKTSANAGDKVVVRYKKPRDQKALDTAKLCATRGLEMVENAIRLSPANESAWSSKTSLLQEKAKLAEMEGQTGRKATYTRLAAEAQARADQIREENRKKAEEVRSY